MNSNTIKNSLLALALAGLASACTADRDAAGATTAAADASMPDPTALVADPDMDGPGHAGAALAARLEAMGRAPAQSFASLPDKGDLVAYREERVVRRTGPYTWHRADVSESHALRAIVDGVLTITAPSGQLMRFEYDRHVEHASGDWTWIGHVMGGSEAQDAIITFGAHAVYGTIARPGERPLKLTMQDGASWLVDTDAEALAAQSRATGRYETPDFLVPDPLEAREVVEGMTRQAMAPSAAQASAVTVDVIIGYTGGFAAQHGSGTLTRLHDLVDIANESYANSAVDMEVRLVHTMQVNYPDATGNSDALTALTGSDGSYPDPANIDAALKPLHDARNQYGADLVTLIRRFNEPENVSCGVAWLIGGGQTETHSGYEVFGFSVVSDGMDGQYYCEDTTYAHELGHNMGLAHDIETAQGDDGTLDEGDYGRFEYSFGHRTGLGDGNFYTVMAYSDGQVHGYHIFSNPRLRFCGGHPCGVVGVSDNAFTLEQTGPIIASFRQSVVVDPPVPVAYVVDDVDGDGKSDLTWRNNAETRFAYWLMDGSSLTTSSQFNVASAWSVVAKGDFNADGMADLVWSNGTVLYLWVGDGAGAFDSTRIGAIPNGWAVSGAGDVDGDFKSDLIWRNAARTRVAVWLMDGADRVGSATYGAGPAWDLRAVADTGGDGLADLAWTNGSRVVVWTSTGTGFDAQNVRSQPSGWTLVAAGDIDGDGKSELHWRSNANNRYAYWRMDGSDYLGGSTWNVGSSWTLATVGDYNGDSFTDLTWTSGTRIVQWVADGEGGYTNANVRAYPTGWTLIP